MGETKVCQYEWGVRVCVWGGGGWGGGFPSLNKTQTPNLSPVPKEGDIIEAEVLLF